MMVPKIEQRTEETGRCINAHPLWNGIEVHDVQQLSVAQWREASLDVPRVAATNHSQADRACHPSLAKEGFEQAPIAPFLK